MRGFRVMLALCIPLVAGCALAFSLLAGCKERVIEVEVDPEFNLSVQLDSANTFPARHLGLGVEIAPQADVEDMRFFVRMEHAGSGNGTRLYLPKDPLEELVAGGDSALVSKGTVRMLFSSSEERIHEFYVIVSNNYGRTKRERVRVAVSREKEPGFRLEAVPEVRAAGAGVPMAFAVRLTQDFPSDRVWYSLRWEMEGEQRAGRVFTTEDPSRQLTPLDTLAITPGDTRLTYESTDEGKHPLRLTVRDSEGRSERVTLSLSVVEPTFTLSTTPASHSVIAGESTEVHVNVAQEFPSQHTRYGLLYRHVGNLQDGLLHFDRVPPVRIDPQDSVGVSAGITRLLFEAPTVGRHDVEVEVRDSRGGKQKSRFRIDAVQRDEPKFTMSMQPDRVEFTKGESATVSLDVVQDYPSDRLKYWISYRHAGQLNGAQLYRVRHGVEEQLVPNDTVRIDPGRTELLVRSSSVGAQRIVLQVQDSYGRVHRQELAMLVREPELPDFNLALDESYKKRANPGELVPINLALNQDYPSDAVKYNLLFRHLGAHSNAQMFLRSAQHEMGQGVRYAAERGSVQLFFKASLVGEHQVELVMEDSRGVSKRVQISVRVELSKRTFTISASFAGFVHRPYICTASDAPEPFRHLDFNLVLTDLDAPPSAEYKLYYKRDGIFNLHDGVTDGVLTQGTSVVFPPDGVLPLRIRVPQNSHGGKSTLQLYVENETGFRAVADGVLNVEIINTPPLSIAWENFLNANLGGDHAPKRYGLGNKVVGLVLKHNYEMASSSRVEMSVRVHRAYLKTWLVKREADAILSKGAVYTKLRYPVGAGSSLRYTGDKTEHNGIVEPKNVFRVRKRQVSPSTILASLARDVEYDSPFGGGNHDNFSHLKPHFYVLQGSRNFLGGVSSHGKADTHVYSMGQMTLHNSVEQLYLVQSFDSGHSSMNHIVPDAFDARNCVFEIKCAVNEPEENMLKALLAHYPQCYEETYGELAIAVDLFVKDAYGYEIKERLHLTPASFNHWPDGLKKEFYE